MAPHPNTLDPDEPLTKEQLQALTRNLAMLSPQNVAEAYRRAHAECHMEGNELPRASAVQELVITWKLVHAWRRRLT